MVKQTTTRGTGRGKKTVGPIRSHIEFILKQAHIVNTLRILDFQTTYINRVLQVNSQLDKFLLISWLDVL